MTTKYKNFLLIFNLLIEAGSDKTSNGEGGIPDILITISAKLLQLLHNNIYLVKFPNIIKSALKSYSRFCKR